MQKVIKIDLPSQDSTKEELVEFVGGIASVCSGINADKKRKYKIGVQCLSDAYGGTPSKPYEYLPSITGIYRNIRSAIKETHLYKEDYIDYIKYAYKYSEDFLIVKCRAINLVWYQLSTHRINSPLKQSKRYLPLDHKIEYWFPKFENNISITESELSNNVENMTVKEFRDIIRSAYNRKELQNRDLNAFELVDFYLCGDFTNMFNERLQKKAQKETREFVQLIKDIK